MALLRDIYDIIKDNPDAIKTLSKELQKFLRGPRFFGKTPTVGEQLNGLKLFVERLSDDEFPNSFNSPLDYLGVLLGTIVQIAYLKKRGCFVKDFYSDGFHLYFPCPANEPELRKPEPSSGKVRALRVKNAAAKQFKPYEFYALKVKSSTPEASQVKSTLETIASEGKGKEVDLFLKTIEELYSDIVKLIGIQELADGQQFVFCSLYGSEDLSLSFSKPQERRKSIADDIQTMFAFTKM